MWGVLELVPLRGEKNSSHAHKAGSGYLLEVLFKISDELFPMSTFVMEHSRPSLGVQLTFEINFTCICES